MVKSKEIKEITLGSVQYVHNPNAAEKWFELYLECITEKFLRSNSKNDGQTYIENKTGGDNLV